MNRGLERGDKRRCQGVNRAGEPCSSTAVGDDGWCPLHRPGANPKAMGARGGRARGKAGGKAAELEQPNGKPVGRRVVAAFEQLLDEVERTGKMTNSQGFASIGRMALEEVRGDPREGHVTVEDARGELAKRFDEIDERRRAHGETCPTCSGSRYVQRASARTDLGVKRPEGPGRAVDIAAGDSSTAAVTSDTVDEDGPEGRSLSGRPGSWTWDMDAGFVRDDDGDDAA